MKVWKEKTVRTKVWKYEMLNSKRKRGLPDWDVCRGLDMCVRNCAIANRGKSPISDFEGKCTGWGEKNNSLEWYQETIGIDGEDGLHYDIDIDTRVKCCFPTFVINGIDFFYPILAWEDICNSPGWYDTDDADEMSDEQEDASED